MWSPVSLDCPSVSGRRPAPARGSCLAFRGDPWRKGALAPPSFVTDRAAPTEACDKVRSPCVWMGLAALAGGHGLPGGPGQRWARPCRSLAAGARDLLPAATAEVTVWGPSSSS